MFGFVELGGQPRRGRQGLLVVSRRVAEQRLAALAIPLSTGGVPIRAADRGEPRQRSRVRARVRAARHRRLRRRPLLERRGPLRQGDADRHPMRIVVRNRAPRGGHHPRPPDDLVPQRVGINSRPSSPALRLALIAPASRRPIRSSAPIRSMSARGLMVDAPTPLLRDRDQLARIDRLPASRPIPRTGSTTTS